MGDVSTPESTGAQVWPAAVALANYFADCTAAAAATSDSARSARDCLAGRSVLELGAGAGLVGLAASALGARRVLLTDVASALPALRQNVRLNTDRDEPGGCAIEVAE